MDAAGAASPGASAWTEHQNADGRIYWFNAKENRSVWEKPMELKTPRERAMAGTPWKAYKSGDRTYYVHSGTKQSSWTLPPELVELFKDLPEDPSTPAQAPPASPAVVQGAASPAVAQPGAASPAAAVASGPPPVYSGPPPGFTAGPLVPAGLPARPEGGPPLGAPVAPRAELQVFDDVNQAQDAFIGMLRQKGVTADWTWEQTMRTIVTEPLFKALKSLSERKAAFNKYIDMLRAKERDEERVRREKATEAWKKLFAGKVKSHNSFETAKKWFSAKREWKLVKDEDEGRIVFDGIIREMKEKEATEAREERHRNMDVLMSLFKNFDMDIMTRWRDAERTVLDSSEYKGDARLQKLDVADMIAVFEEHMRVVEKAEVERRTKADRERHRAERKRREACKQMMQELKDDGTIDANSKWSDIYPLIKDDDRFIAILGQPGSTPLDYFYDIVDALDARLTVFIRAIEKGFKAAGFEMIEDTTRAQFDAEVEKTSSFQDATDQEKELIFQDIRAEAVRRAREERRRAERHQRHQIEDLRYAMKRVDPPLEDRLTLTFEEVQALPEVTSLREWKDCADDATRRSAWEAFVVRTKERQAERAARDAHRERERDGKGRERRRSHSHHEERGSSHEPRRRHHDDDDPAADDSRDRKRERREPMELDYSEPDPAKGSGAQARASAADTAADQFDSSSRDRKRAERRSGRRTAMEVEEGQAAANEPSAEPPGAEEGQEEGRRTSLRRKRADEPIAAAKRVKAGDKEEGEV